MAINRGEAATFAVQLPGATAPVTATVDGVATDTAPALQDGTLDSYDVELTATETDAANLYLLFTDAAGEEYGATVPTFEGTVVATATQSGMTAQGATEALFAELDGLAPAIAALSTDLGPDECTLTLSSVLGDELEGAVVYVSSDLAGTVRSPVHVTDDTGRVKFNLVDGDSYYAWITASGYTGTNPTAFVAVAD